VASLPSATNRLSNVAPVEVMSMGGTGQCVRDLMSDHFQPVAWSGFGNETTREAEDLARRKTRTCSCQAAVKHQMPSWK